MLRPRRIAHVLDAPVLVAASHIVDLGRSTEVLSVAEGRDYSCAPQSRSSLRCDRETRCLMALLSATTQTKYDRIA